MSRPTSRRAALAAFVVLPLAAPSPAAAFKEADGALVRFCDELNLYWQWIDTQAICEDWDDDVLNAHCDRLNAMLETVIESAPSTAAGRAAKAKVIVKELDTFHAQTDRTDRLVQSLLRDCLRDGGVA